MPNLTDLIISALIKRGVCYEARNVEANVDIPTPDTTIHVYVKIENMKITFTKAEEK